MDLSGTPVAVGSYQKLLPSTVSFADFLFGKIWFRKEGFFVKKSYFVTNAKILMLVIAV